MKKDSNTLQKSGIYQITNLVNFKQYIGSSKKLRSRKNSHFADLRKNSHHNQHLQNAWNKYGEDNFKFIILEEILSDLQLLRKAEQEWINFLQPAYNIASVITNVKNYTNDRDMSHILRGKDNPNWKGGLPKCLVCQKQLGNYIAKYCKKCYNTKPIKKLPKNYSHLLVGAKHQNWTGGKNKCQNCDRLTTKYTTKYCVSCHKLHFPNRGKRIKINKIEYVSVSSAAKDLNMTYTELRWKIINNRINYEFLS